jgi:hypothetical protein
LRALAAAARSRWQRLAGNPFGRDLAFVLVLKVALLAALWVFLVRPALHPRHDPAATAAAVAGAAPDSPREAPR